MILHVIPVFDLKQHLMSESCWCEPRNDENGLYVHNSADGREIAELDLGISLGQWGVYDENTGRLVVFDSSGV